MATLITVEADYPPSGAPRAVIRVDDPVGRISLRGRSSDGRTWRVRGGQNVDGSAPPVVIWDYEIPYGVDVDYTATDDGDDSTVTSTPLRIVVDGAWLFDPNSPGAGIPVRLIDVDSADWTSRSSLVPVIGRPSPVPVTRVMSTANHTLKLRVEERELANVVGLLSAGEVLLLRACRPYLTDRWFLPEKVRVRPAGPDLKWRTLELQSQTVTRPEGGILDAPDDISWNAVVDEYPTWNDVVSARPSWWLLLAHPTGDLPEGTQ